MVFYKLKEILNETIDDIVNHSYPKVFIKLQVRFAIAYKQVNITKLC